MTITDRSGPGDETLFDEVRTAFADTRMRETVAGIHARARTRGRRTALAVALVVVVIVATVGVTAALAIRRTTGSAGVPPIVAGFDAECHRAFADLPPAERTGLGDHLPPLVLILAPGTPGALVYGKKENAGDVLCERRSGGAIEISGGASTNPERGFPYPVEDLLLQGGGLPGLGDPGPDPEYVYGRMPRGVTRIDLHLQDGRTIHATLGDGYYGFVATQPKSAVDQTVVYEAGGFYVMDSPALPAGTHVSQPTCDQSISWMLAGSIDLSPAQRAVDPRPIYNTFDNHNVSYYAADRVFLQCIGGAELMAWFPDRPFDANPGALSVVLHDPGLMAGWVAGQAPAGARRVVVRLADGRTIEATLSEGFYFAEFDMSNPGVASVTAYTAAGTQTTTAPN